MTSLLKGEVIEGKVGKYLKELYEKLEPNQKIEGAQIDQIIGNVRVPVDGVWIAGGTVKMAFIFSRDPLGDVIYVFCTSENSPDLTFRISRGKREALAWGMQAEVQIISRLKEVIGINSQPV